MRYGETHYLKERAFSMDDDIRHRGLYRNCQTGSTYVIEDNDVGEVKALAPVSEAEADARSLFVFNLTVTGDDLAPFLAQQWERIGLADLAEDA